MAYELFRRKKNTIPLVHRSILPRNMDALFLHLWHAIHSAVQKLHLTIGILVITLSHQGLRDPF